MQVTENTLGVYILSKSNWVDRAKPAVSATPAKDMLTTRIPTIISIDDDDPILIDDSDDDMQALSCGKSYCRKSADFRLTFV